MKRIIPSVASANQLFLAEEIGAFPAGTLLHVDIEDGNFVNNITFGMRTVRSIANMFPQHPLCFHFMATNPSILRRSPNAVPDRWRSILRACPTPPRSCAGSGSWG